MGKGPDKIRNENFFEKPCQSFPPLFSNAAPAPWSKDTDGGVGADARRPELREEDGHNEDDTTIELPDQLSGRVGFATLPCGLPGAHRPTLDRKSGGRCVAAAHGGMA